MSVLIAGVAGLVAAQLASEAARASAKPVIAWETAANSAVLGIVPAISGASLTTTIGQSIAAYEQTEAQASSATVNLGGLGYIVGNSPFCGQIAFPTNKQPQPLSADSADGRSSQTTLGNLPGEGTQLGPGTESVSVSPNPELATATTAPLSQAIGSALSLSGEATSTVRYLANSEQEADASVSEDLTLLGGLVEIHGMRWTASQHTGSVNSSTATFAFGSVTIAAAGIPVTLPSNLPVASALRQVNAVLVPLGLSLNLPARSVDPGTGAISMGPLQLHFSGSSLENKLLAPTSNGLASLEAYLAGQSGSGTDCSNIRNLIGQLANPTESIVNVLVGAAEGAGGVDLDLGGASAGTVTAPGYVNPFGGASNPLPPVSPPRLASGTHPSTAVSTSPGVPATVTPPAASQSSASVPSTPGVAAANPIPTAQPTRSAPPAARAGLIRCVTTSPAGHPGCWKGVGTAAAGAVVILGAGLLAADIWQGRRPRRRRPPRRALNG